MKLIFLAMLLSFPMVSQAAPSPGPLFVYEGILTNSSGGPYTTPQTVTLQILYAGSCVAYEETQTINPGALGEFSVTVGTGTRTDLTANTADRIFATSGSIDCSGAAAMAVAGWTNRSLHIRVGATDLTPDIEITSIPFAINAQRLGDKQASDFVQTSGTITQGRLADTFSRYSSLDKALNIFSSPPTAGHVLMGDGTNFVMQALAGLPPTGAAGGYLTGTYPNPVLAGNIVQSTHIKDGTIEDIDISAAAGIQDSKLAQITLPGKVANSATTGTSTKSPNTLVLRDASSNFNAGMITVDALVTDNLTVKNSSGGFLMFKLNPGASATSTLYWPVNTGINGQVLTTNGSSQLDWVTPSWGPATGGIAYNLGRVGIGTSNPTEKLEVQGSVKADGFQVANCPSGMSLVPMGRESFCISSVDSVATWSDATNSCVDNDRVLCSSSQYLAACRKGTIATLSPRWTDQFHNNSGDSFVTLMCDSGTSQFAFDYGVNAKNYRCCSR